MQKKTLKKLKQEISKTADKGIITNKKNIYLSLLILFAVTFITFSTSLKNDFVDWDDKSYIVENEQTFQQHNIFYYFGKKAYMGNYHPFTMALYDIQYSIAGLSPFLFHLTMSYYT